jgi:hypothetical protein
MANKAKIGRPRKSASERYLNPVRQVGRWDDESWGLVKKAAEHMGISVAEFARKAILREAKKVMGG